MSFTRQEFEDYLKGLFYGLAFTSIDKNFEIMLTTNDKTIFDSYATNYLRAQERISYYLTEWDNAADQAAKDAVAASVVGSLGSAQVNPDDAYMWPGSGGLFGDVKGPLDLQSYERSYFASVDGTSTGNTLITTIPSAKVFIPQCANFTLVTVVGLSLVATVSIGSNASTYDNIIPATLLTGLSTENQTYKLNLSGINANIGATDPIYCRVSIASTATTYDLVASVSGFLLDA